METIVYKNTLNAADFGVNPDTGADVSAAIENLMAQCSDNTKIIFPKGKYIFKSKKWIDDFDALMSGRLDPDTRWGAEGIPFNSAIAFNGYKNLEIDGQGSMFIFEGLVQPFEFSNCKNIFLHNLSIDWGRPLFSQGCITKIEHDSVEIDISSGYPLSGGEPVWSFHDFYLGEGHYGKICPFREMTPLELVGPQKVRFRYSQAEMLEQGSLIVIRHIGNYRPCIHIKESSNVVFEDVAIHACPGMGVIGFRSEDIAFRRFRVYPSGNRIMSSNTDATHFISCKGIISFIDSEFKGMGDDAANVHGFYFSIKEKIDERTVRAFIDAGSGTQNQLVDYPDAGDTAEFVRRDTLMPYSQNKIEYSEVDEKTSSLIIRFADPLPDGFCMNDVVANTTRTAKLRFTGCTVKDIRARGLLVQTRGAVIENNTFDHCTGTGIHVNTAAGWWESVGTRDVVIRNNRFTGCGYGPGTCSGASGISVQTECESPAVGIHKNITIEDNEIDGVCNTGIHLGCADSALIQRNKISNCENPIRLEYSNNIVVKENHISSSKNKVIIGNGCTGIKVDGNI